MRCQRAQLIRVVQSMIITVAFKQTQKNPASRRDCGRLSKSLKPLKLNSAHCRHLLLENVQQERAFAVIVEVEPHLQPQPHKWIPQPPPNPRLRAEITGYDEQQHDGRELRATLAGCHDSLYQVYIVEFYYYITFPFLFMTTLQH